MARIPSSTYRIQLHKNFNFDDAAAIAEYLHALGISHVYSSPYLQAAPGSMHGYDVVDHQRVNDELGGEMAHQRFCEKLGQTGLGQVLDIVPNHMSLGSENRYWWDVLENGTSSRYASFFDIDWQPQEERLRDKVLVPILGDQYGRVLQSGGIKLVRNGSLFQVECSGQALPAAPTSLPSVLVRGAEYAKSDTLSFLAASFGRLPSPEYVDRRTILARHRDKVVLQTLLARLCREEPTVCEMIDQAVTELNQNLDALDDFLNQQNYRLAYWKTADQELSYRRFFDVNTLIGLRVEREYVFEETHALIIDWLKRGVIDGVRVDHPDGLRDPQEYFNRLRQHAPDVYIVGEKILEGGEFLRKSWPIQGTSGYDFLNVAIGLLVSPDGMMDLARFYGDFTGQPIDFPEIAREKKLNVLQEALGSDVNRLTSIFVEICEANRDRRDYTRAEIRRVVREVAACFSVYRSYVVPEREEITVEDREHIVQATECAKQRRPDIDDKLFDFMCDVLTMKVKGRLENEFVLRFQQFTGPAMAKGVEDTAFYCYNRMTAMNEVGGDPGRDEISIEEFHAYCRKMLATHPLTMTTLSTHDTKRSEDVRARLAVLSEMPDKFSSAVNRWSRMNNLFKVTRRGMEPLPDRNTEWMYYQTLIGAWPISVERAQTYMLKAVREAKQQTSWVANNKEFEDALQTFIECTLNYAPFVKELEQFVARVCEPGRINSLAQTLLKYTAPGVPDLYQGCELWDLSLVDPDNRRPVDYEHRKNLLRDLRQMTGEDVAVQVMNRSDDGLPKMWTIYHALHLRTELPECFGAEGTYEPLEVDGPKYDHVIAYLRGGRIATVVQRMTVKLSNTWKDTTVILPEGRWKNRLTGGIFDGGRISMKVLLKDFSVALLVREG